MIRLMVYANEFDLELLIATGAGTPGESKEAITRPDLIRRLSTPMARCCPTCSGTPRAGPVESLRARVISGNPIRGRQHIGAGHDTAASRALDRPHRRGHAASAVEYHCLGRADRLAQALWRVKQDGERRGWPPGTQARVYDIGDQDGIADWMRTEFPGMHYVFAKAPPGRDFRDAVYRGMTSR